MKVGTDMIPHLIVPLLIYFGHPEKEVGRTLGNTLWYDDGF
jgi:hypothetical protein